MTDSDQLSPVACDTPGYESLRRVLRAAYDQASVGKGAVRHATGQIFDKQPIMTITDLVGPGFAFGQAIKKIEESRRMAPGAAETELLGAIVYLAAAVLHLQKTSTQATNA